MSTIQVVKAREILDSRGKPTLEVELFTDSGSFLASVPSGTSKGKHEAKPYKKNLENQVNAMSNL